MQWWPRTDSEGSQRGLCAETTFDPGDCKGGLSGSWEPGASSGVHSLADCVAACKCCSACRFISFSAANKDCSWYRSCDLSGLTTDGVAAGYVTLAVHKARAPPSSSHHVSKAKHPN